MERRLPPLLTGAVQRDLEGLDAERSMLAERIENLPANSTKRPRLQARLEMLTLHALRTENERSR